MSVNLSDSTPAALAGSTNVVWQTDGAGNVSGSMPTGVALAGSGFNATVQSANISATDLVPAPAADTRYRVSGYVVVTTVDGASSTLPKIVLTWNDADNGQAQSVDLTATSTGNTLATFKFGVAFLSVDVSAALSFSTTGYASGTPTTMKYAIHIVVEKL
jgi:hypothetical protein